MAEGSAARTITADRLGNAIAEDLEVVDHMVVAAEEETVEIEGHPGIDRAAAEEEEVEAVLVVAGVATLTHTYQAMEGKTKAEEETTDLLAMIEERTTDDKRGGADRQWRMIDSEKGTETCIVDRSCRFETECITMS